MSRYDTLKKQLIYDFKVGYGGIGDLLKFFIYTLRLCIKHNVRLYYLVNNIPLEKYIKLKNPKMYISKESTAGRRYNQIQTASEIGAIRPNECAFICPWALYSSFTFEEDTEINADEVFYFSDEVKSNVKNILQCEVSPQYTSIHLRLGDKFLETDKSFVLCKDDARDYSEEALFKFIRGNSDRRLLFFCDNGAYKLKIKETFENIMITDSKIGHISLSNTTDAQVLDTVTEFYILTNSDEIVCASQSGFSKMASLFGRTPMRVL